MAFHPDDIYIARDEDDTFRAVCDGGVSDESNMNEADIFELMDSWDDGTGTLHVYDPKYPHNRGLWNAPVSGTEYGKYMSWLDGQAWEKGLT